MRSEFLERPLHRSLKVLAAVAVCTGALIALNIAPTAREDSVSQVAISTARNELFSLHVGNEEASETARAFQADPTQDTAKLFEQSQNLLNHIGAVLALQRSLGEQGDAEAPLQKAYNAIRTSLALHDAEALSGALMSDRWNLDEYTVQGFQRLGDRLAQEGIRAQRDQLRIMATRTLSILLIVALMTLFILAQQRKALKSSSQKLAAAVHELDEAQRIARLGTVRWDFLSNTVRWSDQFAQIFGLPLGGSLNGADFEALLHPDDADKVRATEVDALRRSASSGRPELREVAYRARRSDGTFVEVYSKSELMADATGRPLFMVSTVRDITEKALRERRLAESERNLENAQRIARLGSFSNDLRSGEIIWSKEMYRLLGLLPERGPVPVREILHGEDRAAFKRQLDDLMRPGPARGERQSIIKCRLLANDGSVRHVRVNAVMTYDHAGAANVYSGTVQDISAEVAQEASLKSAVSEAERANRAKSDFLAVMSHELRTPLNGVLGMLGALQESRLDPDQREQVGIARNSATDLLNILNDLLDMAKIEAGKLELEMAPFEVGQLVRSVIQLHAHRALEKGIVLESRIAADVPNWLNADSARLRQILVNFVNNSIKFTPSGTITLVLSMVKHTVPGREAMLSCSITDTGIGIPYEKQPHVFEQFNQLDLSYNRRFGGTGLGLSICRSLAELMNGEISFVSTPGIGSTFSVTIPVQPAEAQQGRVEDVAPVKLPHMRVLVAEDNGTNQIVARSMLERMGQSVDTVGDGLEAVEAVARFDYDLVLMDLSMPRLDGYDATRRIRALGPKQTQVPIIALTAHAGAEVLKACRDAGFSDVLTKPLLQPLLQEVLAKLALGKEATVLRSLVPQVLHAEKADHAERQRVALTDRAESLISEIGEDAVARVFDAGVIDLERHLATFARFTEGAPSQQGHVSAALHSIVGIAGTLGCMVLADDARKLEHAEGLGPQDARLQSLVQGIIQLRQDLEVISTRIRAGDFGTKLELAS